MSRPLALLVLAALLVAALLPAPAAPQGTPPAARCSLGGERHWLCVEILHQDVIFQNLRDHLYKIAWLPGRNPVTNLHEALIVGGQGNDLNVGAPAHSIILLWDGIRVSKIWDREGPQFVDIAWAPDGSYGIVVSDRRPVLRVDPPRLGDPSYRFRDIWAECDQVAVANCEEASFYGKAVAFHPSGAYAWITGSSLLQYDGRALTVVESGHDIAYRAIAWSPSGDRALLSALVCADPSDAGVDVPCQGDIAKDRIVPGRVLLAEVGQRRICEVATYGLYGPQRAEVNGITWHPSGDYALIYGDDNFRGTFLRYDPYAAATGTSPGGCPRLENSFRYLSSVKPEGEFNEVVYHPPTDRFWAAGGGGQEIWEGNGTEFRFVVGEHEIVHDKGTIYYGVGFDPTQRYMLVSGFDGRLYKVVPANRPYALVISPKNNTAVTGTVVLGGTVISPSEFEGVDQVEVEVRKVEVGIEPLANATGPRNATITDAHGALPAWSLPWDPRESPPGYYRVRATVVVDGQPQEPVERVVRFSLRHRLDPGPMETFPPFDPGFPHDLRWSGTKSGNVLVGYNWTYRLEARLTPASRLAAPPAGSADRVEVEVQPVRLATSPLATVKPWEETPIRGSYRGFANWSLPWDSAAVEPGFYEVRVRGALDGNRSNIGVSTLQVVEPSLSLQTPRLEPLPAESRDGNYTLRWSSVGPGITYELEEAWAPGNLGASGGEEVAAGLAFAGGTRLLYAGPEVSFEVAEQTDGHYFYRVRARSASALSPWSGSASVLVTVDTDGDGFGDEAEIAAGAQPGNASSTPDDLDGDGRTNAQDAFPLDAAESKDTDGDGVGDGRDRFPLDLRDWADRDGDGWGDNAEVRLASDAAEASSTPETDDDADGCLNKDEAEAGTLAKDPSQAPAWCRRGGPRGPAGDGGANATPGAGALAALAGLGAAGLAARRSRPRRP